MSLAGTQPGTPAAHPIAASLGAAKASLPKSRTFRTSKKAMVTAARLPKLEEASEKVGVRYEP